MSRAEEFKQVKQLIKEWAELKNFYEVVWNDYKNDSTRYGEYVYYFSNSGAVIAQ